MCLNLSAARLKPGFAGIGSTVPAGLALDFLLYPALPGFRIPPLRGFHLIASYSFDFSAFPDKLGRTLPGL